MFFSDSILELSLFVYEQHFLQSSPLLIGLLQLELTLFYVKGAFYSQVNSDWLVTNFRQRICWYVHLWFACVSNICTHKKLRTRG